MKLSFILPALLIPALLYVYNPVSFAYHVGLKTYAINKAMQCVITDPNCKYKDFYAYHSKELAIYDTSKIKIAESKVSMQRFYFANNTGICQNYDYYLQQCISACKAHGFIDGFIRCEDNLPLFAVPYCSNGICIDSCFVSKDGWYCYCRGAKTCGDSVYSW